MPDRQLKVEAPPEPVRRKEVVINGVTVLELTARKIIAESRLSLVEHAWDKALAEKESDPGSDECARRMAKLCDLIAANPEALDVLLGRKIVVDG